MEEGNEGQDFAQYEERKKSLEETISLALLNMEKGEKIVISSGGLNITLEKNDNGSVLRIAETELEIGKIENLKDNKVAYNEANLKALVKALGDANRPIRRFR